MLAKESNPTGPQMGGTIPPSGRGRSDRSDDAPVRRPIEILIVEDNPGDARLVAEVLGGSKVTHRIRVARDGVEAMEALRAPADGGKTYRPDLMLLDLNLPRKDGREVLAEVKRDPELRSIPVLVLTSSSADADVVHAYDLHANCYMTKPANLYEYIRLVHAIEGFWMDLARLPEDRLA